MTFLNGMIVAGVVSTQLINGQSYAAPLNSYAMCNLTLYTTDSSATNKTINITIGGMPFIWCNFSGQNVSGSWMFSSSTSAAQQIVAAGSNGIQVLVPFTIFLPAGVGFVVSGSSIGARLNGQLIANKA